MAANKHPSVVESCEALAAPLLEELGLKLWDIKYEKEGSSWFLRYFIDKDGGVTIEDCENFSRRVDKILDEVDPIDQSYYLEVSSPGIERELRKREHFEACLGERITVKTIRPIEGRQEFVGKLLGEGDGKITIQPEGEEPMELERNQVAYVRLYNDFLDGGEE